MIDFPDTLLPNRPLRTKKPPIIGGYGAFLAGLLFLALTVGLGIWQGPGIVRDFIISQNPLVVHDSIVRNGECREQRFITTCEADVRYTYDGKTLESHISLGFIDFSSGDYMVDVVISRDQPQLVTLSLGLDMFWNRVAVGGVFALLFGGLGVAGIWRSFAIGRANRIAKTGALARPVALEIVRVSKPLVGGKVITYRVAAEGKNGNRQSGARFKKKQDFLVAEGSTGETYALGVQLEGMKDAILLDAGLERLDLTAGERLQFTAALDALGTRKDAA